MSFGAVGDATLIPRLGELLQSRGWVMATAESCTGGGVAYAITSQPGSSTWFDCGFVTYSNAAKQRMLGVQAATLMQHGAVSEAVVAEMAQGALAHSQAQLALAISGIAGPGGAVPGKPVGTVCFGWALASGQANTTTLQLPGTREQVRAQAVDIALQGAIDLLTRHD